MSITSGNDGALKNLAADVKGNDHTAPDDTGALRHKGVAVRTPFLIMALGGWLTIIIFCTVA